MIFDILFNYVSDKIAPGTGGAPWTSRALPVSGVYNALRYENGYFLAGNTGGKVLYSGDGINWSSPVSNITAPIVGFAYGNGIYVVATNSNKIGIRSGDVSGTWTEASVTGNGVDIAFGNGVFVRIINNVNTYQYHNGTTWLTGNNPLGVVPTRIKFLNGLFIMSSGGKTAVSSNGINWTLVLNNVGGVGMGAGIMYDDDLGLYYVILGYSGGYKFTVCTSPDGLNWTTYTTDVNYYSKIIDAEYNNGVFIVTVNGGSLRRTIDFKTWSYYYLGANMDCMVDSNDDIMVSGAYSVVYTAPTI